MISTIHLFWIIPVAVLYGFIVGALLATAKRADEQRGGDCSQ